ncbi:hypothetical protein scyTo_0000737 [Scyliorhinus torazame]|uniref:TGFBR3/Endoglin-like N-terminal domain-containing protein n=1 Tax=Scyliorhinus torazame TaxID=75743 RepID=A0A401P2Z6_SCYTO|nr:hypothetical protein [Scyliorhinus torazame]
MFIEFEEENVKNSELAESEIPTHLKAGFIQDRRTIHQENKTMQAILPVVVLIIFGSQIQAGPVKTNECKVGKVGINHPVTISCLKPLNVLQGCVCSDSSSANEVVYVINLIPPNLLQIFLHVQPISANKTLVLILNSNNLAIWNLSAIKMPFTVYVSIM